MAYNHRIDTEEMATRLTVPVQGTSALQVVVGTCPINMAEDPGAVTNVPIITYSFTEAQKLLGYSDDFKQYTLCQSMDVSYRVFSVAPVIFINVLDAVKHKKVFSKEGISVKDRKASIMEAGVFLNNLELKAGTDTPLAAGVDYIAEFNTSGGIDITLLTSEKTADITLLSASGEQLDPSKVTKEDIIGGYDAATGKETGLEVIRQVYPKLNLVPGLILAPGWSQDPEVAAVIAAKTRGINGVFHCEAAIDMDTSKAKVYTALREAKEAAGIINEHVILLWPKVRLGTKVYCFSAVWAAMTAYTDARNNNIPMKSPSNELLNMGAAVLDDGTEVLLDTTQAELVNSFGVVTAINDNGWRAWGNNTAAYPGITDPKDRWISCRRMMSWYRNHFLLTFKEKVDNPGNYRLIESVVDSENLYLNSLSHSGYIAGGVISFQEDENPITSILDGNIIFYTKIAFWVPAEYIKNNIEFDPEILAGAIGGGAA
ncbi:MAG: phage tail sheath family protein [Lachnospiraceae bacterium]|jgi:phage tail sheath protein FI|nr:phage tail sheath family protein [Lachnospiraceae bacterium]